MHKYGVSTWKAIPLLRILVPLVAGIITTFHLDTTVIQLVICLGTGISLQLFTSWFDTPKLYSFRWISGVGLHLVFFALGGFLVIEKDVQNNQAWVGKYYKNNDAVVATILEPLVEKEKTYKALASAESLVHNDTATAVKGKILLYFYKDSSQPSLKYGSQVLVKKTLQQITNSGNPGAFDYRRYCAFQGIHHQVFLKPGDYTILNTRNRSWFTLLLINTRGQVLSVLRKYIKSKDEVAVAEALLIGYKDDLDKTLVQSYSNTGVVHIIAISGLHLGMIYGLLMWLFKPARRKQWNRFVQPVVILLVIWVFTFLAGAVPSILRSAVMFTCIIIGETLSRKTSIYNSLAASAFILLLINPFYLWDAGFQLSFTAVLGIVAFSKHIYNWFYFENKLLKGIWGLSSVTLAAQLLTLPVILYHFHQFPNLFLFTNIIIVPLSGMILFAELFLLLVSFSPPIAAPAGETIEWLIWLMNTLIQRTERIPFALQEGIYITLLQSILIYPMIICTCFWLLRKNREMLFAACISMMVFLSLRGIDLIRTNYQRKMIVYNIPQHTAIDVVEGDRYYFVGDTQTENDAQKNYHLGPSRIANRVKEGLLESVIIRDNVIESRNKKAIIISQSLPGETFPQKIKSDVIVITGNPALSIRQLTEQYQCGVLVFDASNPPWKIRLWKKECDSLHLRHHSIPEQGAFEMDL